MRTDDVDGYQTMKAELPCERAVAAASAEARRKKNWRKKRRETIASLPFNDTHLRPCQDLTRLDDLNEAALLDLVSNLMVISPPPLSPLSLSLSFTLSFL